MLQQQQQQQQQRPMQQGQQQMTANNPNSISEISKTLNCIPKICFPELCVSYNSDANLFILYSLISVYRSHVGFWGSSLLLISKIFSDSIGSWN